MFTIPSSIGNLNIKFTSASHAYIEGAPLKINGVLYKATAHIYEHENGVWELHPKGGMPYEGKPYMYRCDAEGHTLWGKEPTPVAYKVARAAIEDAFRSRVENWKEDRTNAERTSLESYIASKEREIGEKEIELDNLKAERTELQKKLKKVS